MPRRHDARQEPPTDPRRPVSTRTFLISLLLLAFCAITVTVSILLKDRPAPSAGGGSTPAGGNIAPAVDPAKLVGRWARSDGDYMLEIRSVAPDGKLAASYYNPRPINVSRAELRERSPLTVFVELRDVNYPGSTYLLRYDKDRDLLFGVYHQATQGQDYEVYFERLAAGQ